jgi:hypothetical protein
VCETCEYAKGTFCVGFEFGSEIAALSTTIKLFSITMFFKLLMFVTNRDLNPEFKQLVKQLVDSNTIPS